MARSLQGGSTITEQLAKISLYGGADPPQSIDYKIKEIVLGNEIALNFTKNEILDMYVNRIFYGNFAVGVGSAAELYFWKTASQLDLAQASMLAGLPQSPTAYNPLLHDPGEAINPRAKSRQKAVLQAMQASGYITQAQGVAAYNEKLTVHSWNEIRAQSTIPTSSITSRHISTRTSPSTRAPAATRFTPRSTRRSRTSPTPPSTTWWPRSGSPRTWATARW